MKGLKKLALATAVAAAPFAQAELTAMDDALLADMTGQAGITIDVDLQMTIDAIKYVDQDGSSRAELDLNGDGDFTDPDEAEVTSGVQGAITAKTLAIGSIDDTTGALSAAQIRGVTIDADGSQGLTIGFGKIGDTAGNGIDISVEAVLINAGQANLSKYEAGVEVATFNGTFGTSYTTADYAAGTVSADMNAAIGAAVGATTTAEQDAAAAASGGAFADGSAVLAAAATGDQTAIGLLAAQNAGVAGAAAQAGAANNVGAALANAQAGASGNVGGIVIEDFRNYIQDDLVNEYNGVFDMALMDSTGAITGDVNGGGNSGRYVRGELAISGTGTYDASGNGNNTGGLKIAGKFGGAIDKAAWVDGDGQGAGAEFGVRDLGFFHGIDTNGDDIADTIEGMHFEMNIDVVDRASSVEDAQVAALHISDMKLEGTIMMGELYLGGTYTDTSGPAPVETALAERSLGSVLIKDIDMTGTSVYIYGR